MNWSPLQKPQIIAARATLAQIQEAIQEARESLAGHELKFKFYRNRPGKDVIQVRRMAVVQEAIEKKIRNLEAAAKIKEASC